MILVDTSVWVDHLRAGEAQLVSLLNAGRVVMHPFVVGELALGHLRQRQKVMEALQGLPKAKAATDAELLQFIDQQQLAGLGIGYVDAHLLASVRLVPGARLWTRDQRLQHAASARGLAFEEPVH